MRLIPNLKHLTLFCKLRYILNIFILVSSWPHSTLEEIQYVIQHETQQNPIAHGISECIPPNYHYEIDQDTPRCPRKPLESSLKCQVMHYRVALKILKHPLYKISKNSTSLFVHYCKGNVLEDLPGLVDFTVMLNVNDKQIGALSKLQHFVGNRMSIDIMSRVVCMHPSLE